MKEVCAVRLVDNVLVITHDNGTVERISEPSLVYRTLQGQTGATLIRIAKGFIVFTTLRGE